VSGFISDTDLQRIRDAVDIVDLVKEHVPLKRAGKDFRGLCPFHQEKTPSFYVVPAKQIFKCFGCGAAGNAFSFVMKQEGVDFVEAVRTLARRAGITITEAPGERQKRSVKERIYEANQWAAEIFHEQLMKSPAGEHAREYVKKRGLSPAMTKAFLLGYSLPEWEGLLKRAKAEPIDPQLLVDAGLAGVRREGGYRDQFRNRLMFPIVDQRDHVIAFGARTLDGSEPKYLNSPETPVFSKSQTLYGLSQAKEAMQKKGRTVVVEGYTDVIMAHQHGFAETVAVLGTSLTRDHVRLLRRYADNAVLLLDQDAAGQASAERSLEAFVAEGMPMTVGALSADDDPCDFLLKEGAEPFEKALSGGLDALSFKLERMKAARGGRWDTVGALDPLLETVGLITDPVAREFALKELAKKTGISDMALESRLSQINRPRARTAVKAREEQGDRRDPQRELLCVALWSPLAMDMMRERLDLNLLPDVMYRVLCQRAMQLAEAEGGADASALLAHTQDEQERSVVEGILALEPTKGDAGELCDALLRRLNALHAENAADELARELSVTDEARQAQVLEELGRLRRQGKRGIGFGRPLLSNKGSVR
jgi:DNA primase